MDKLQIKCGIEPVDMLDILYFNLQLLMVVSKILKQCLLAFKVTDMK